MKEKRGETEEREKKVCREGEMEEKKKGGFHLEESQKPRKSASA